MKAKLILTGLVVVAALGAGDEPGSPLKPFMSTEGRFSILLPGTPKAERVPIADPADHVLDSFRLLKR